MPGCLIMFYLWGCLHSAGAQYISVFSSCCVFIKSIKHLLCSGSWWLACCCWQDSLSLSLFSTPLSPPQSGFSRSRLSWSYPSSSAACLSSSSSASSSLCRRVDASSSLEPSRSLPVSSSPLTHSHNFYITWVNIIKMYLKNEAFHW